VEAASLRSAQTSSPGSANDIRAADTFAVLYSKEMNYNVSGQGPGNSGNVVTPVGWKAEWSPEYAR
jgi:hypothetical protein